MNILQKQTVDRMNELGKQGKPFVFIIDFAFGKPLLFEDIYAPELLWKTPVSSNYHPLELSKKQIEWDICPVDYNRYKQSFDLVQKYIHNGDTYLLNLTQPTPVHTNLSPEEIFHHSQAPYKIWLKDQFVCFSPEIFVRINDGKILSFPMKGTIDATQENAGQMLQNDEKEVAEHHTIVDLIRNDLSRVASGVEVEQFMYLDRIITNNGEILQMSSQISGKLQENYQASIGSLLAELLPAGSISGAPKAKTLEIIREAEQYERGYYSGIFGYFDGRNLDSCVLIRYVELSEQELLFKSGGGITFLSDCQSEYNELIQKVYVPIS